MHHSTPTQHQTQLHFTLERNLPEPTNLSQKPRPIVIEKLLPYSVEPQLSSGLNT